MIYIQKPNNFNPKFEVVSCFFEYDGKLLFLHRPEHKSQGNKWGIPGGKIDEGETMNQAMLREIKEETSVDLLENDLEYLRTLYVRYDTHDFVYHMYKCIFVNKPEVILREVEHDGFNWFTPEETLTLDLIDDMKPCIKMIYRI